jgi:hypothetical protein
MSAKVAGWRPASRQSVGTVLGVSAVPPPRLSWVTAGSTMSADVIGGVMPAHANTSPVKRTPVVSSYQKPASHGRGS